MKRSNGTSAPDSAYLGSPLWAPADPNAVPRRVNGELHVIVLGQFVGLRRAVDYRSSAAAAAADARSTATSKRR